MKYLIVLVAAVLTGCASTPRAPMASGFSVDQFIAVTLQYHGDTLAGASTYGPTEKKFACERAGESAVVQSKGLLPKGDQLVATCLRIAFGGPLPAGAEPVEPAQIMPLEWITIAVEYDAHGGFVGAQALYTSADVESCHAKNVVKVKSNYADGHVAAGNSLLLYCLPVPSLSDDEGMPT